MNILIIMVITIVICAGYKSNEIIKYFKNLLDFKLVKRKKSKYILFKTKKWMINIFYTGNNSNTGGRLLK